MCACVCVCAYVHCVCVCVCVCVWWRTARLCCCQQSTGQLPANGIVSCLRYGLFPSIWIMQSVPISLTPQTFEKPLPDDGKPLTNATLSFLTLNDKTEWKSNGDFDPPPQSSPPSQIRSHGRLSSTSHILEKWPCLGMTTTTPTTAAWSTMARHETPSGQVFMSCRHESRSRLVWSLGPACCCL